MSRIDLERAVLATLIFRPQYFDQTELTPVLFSPGRFRKTYELISELWETTRSEISLPVLAQRIGGEEPASFVSALTDGLLHYSPEQFLQSIEELKWIRRGASSPASL
jgi:hypothetical protein